MSIKYAIALVLDDYRIEFNKVEDDRIAALKTPQSYAFERGIKSRSGKQKTTDAIKKILANYFYAGYTTSKLSDKMNKGLHEALVSLEVIKKNREIIDGTINNYFLHGDNNNNNNNMFPLRGGFLLCARCGHLLLGSAPKGNGGSYPQYHCAQPCCRKKITDVSPAVSLDKAHDDFRALLRSLKPLNDGVSRLFKEIVVQEWNAQFEQAINTSSDLTARISRLEEFTFQINKKFIENKISIDERDLQKSANENEIKSLRKELDEVEQYKENY